MRTTPKPRRAFPVADRFRDGILVETRHPRLEAIRFLRERIADGRAGLDPFDPTIFIVHALPHERVFGYRCLELCGEVLTTGDNEDGSRRMRATLAPDVRGELELSKPGAPLMLDEPLASRGVRSIDRVMEVVLDVLPPPRFPASHAEAIRELQTLRPTLTLLESQEG